MWYYVFLIRKAFSFQFLIFICLLVKLPFRAVQHGAEAGFYYCYQIISYEL
jgi:hypothetical protein